MKNLWLFYSKPRVYSPSHYQTFLNTHISYTRIYLRRLPKNSFFRTLYLRSYDHFWLISFDKKCPKTTLNGSTNVDTGSDQWMKFILQKLPKLSSHTTKGRYPTNKSDRLQRSHFTLTWEYHGAVHGILTSPSP